MNDFFDSYEGLKGDPIFALSAEADADKRPEKADLLIGVYKDADLHLVVFDSVKQAERIIDENETDKNYLGIAGLEALVDATGRLIFGNEGFERIQSKTCGLQALGGTGALRLGADLLVQKTSAPLYLPDPTWSNHFNIFKRAGFTLEQYPYYDRERQCYDHGSMLRCLKEAPAHSVIVLHGCCHNPSGDDPSIEQWEEIANVCKEQKLIPLFDLAYLGFGEGINEDAQSIRLFARLGLEFLVACSFSKNLSLYGERSAVLLAVTSESAMPKVKSQLMALARANYSNPPRHAGLLAEKVLTDPVLRKSWEKELAGVRQRIAMMRVTLCEALCERLPTMDFDHLTKRRGMFCLLHITPEQAKFLRSEKGIYLSGSGRINLAALNLGNVNYVADAIAAVLK